MAVRWTQIHNWVLPSVLLHLHACLGRCVRKRIAKVSMADFLDFGISTWSGGWVFVDFNHGGSSCPKLEDIFFYPRRVYYSLFPIFLVRPFKIP
jgi:hypothetical protein